MKLVRYGDMGAEKPGMIDADGALRDLSGHVDDITGAVLTNAGLDALRAIDPQSLPVVAGNPRMGAASCFGSPLFNMLIGFGFSLTYATFTNGPFCLERDKTVPVGFIFLLGSMVMSCVAIPCSGFMLTKRYGAVLIGYYVLFMTTSLVLQNAVAESWWDAHVWPWFQLGSAVCTDAHE